MAELLDCCADRAAAALPVVWQMRPSPARTTTYGTCPCATETGPPAPNSLGCETTSPSPTYDVLRGLVADAGLRPRRPPAPTARPDGRSPRLLGLTFVLDHAAKPSIASGAAEPRSLRIRIPGRPSQHGVQTVVRNSPGTSTPRGACPPGRLGRRPGPPGASATGQSGRAGARVGAAREGDATPFPDRGSESGSARPDHLSSMWKKFISLRGKLFWG